jgi:FkbM family methyltransferase
MLANLLIKPSIYKSSYEERFLIDFFSNTNQGIFVDIGGNHPDSAVSKIFWDTLWKGFVVEPLPDHAQKFRDSNIDVEECALTSPEKATAGEMTFTVADRQSTLDAQQIMDDHVITGAINVTVKTLGELVKERGWKHLNFLSIDTEGTEVDVLRGTNFSEITCDLILIEDWGRDFSIHHYLTSQGFKRVRRTGFNSWYIPKSTPWITSLYGRLQFFRKFILSMPFKKLRKWRHEHSK